MIVVKMELWPGGDPTAARKLGEIHITNDNTGSAAFGNYDVALYHAGAYAHRPGIWKTGKVIGFARRLSPYRLLCRALRACKEI